MDDKVEIELRKFVAPEFIFGKDARLKAGKYCRYFGAKNVLIVTDKGITKTPWLNEVIASIEEEEIQYKIFSSVSPNPRDFEVMQGAQYYQENKCDILLAIGGGSVLDCAKGIGIVSTNHKQIHAFEGVDMIDVPMPPLICIPTTGGTAADVSQFAIINNTVERYKMAIISKAVVPDIALIDPVPLTSMNHFLTACTGMDVLSHAFEAFVSNASSNFTDLHALESIRLINQNLIPSVKNPSDLQARGKVALASLYAGLAFSNASLGCVHSMAHSLGGYLDLPHGECNAILLPHVVNYNFQNAPEKYKTIAENMDIKTNHLTQKQIKEELTNKLIALKKELDILSTLNQKGVTSSVIPQLAKKAIKDPCNATNPRPPEERDLEVIYSEAM
ncbi:alcohol dehydrogenase-like regulatory protein ErcA [Sunxiuqinia sp. A32]|uniref:alcohol dehydrogenase-like regulatory protein ErcA n=1 Tax=Sunxiuqinia sp. A32 TaxID=3461496 RepID=UPI004046657D